MLHAITWKQFGIAVGGAALLYYLLILFKYYRQEITALLNGRKDLPMASAPGSATPKPDPGVFGAATIDDSEMNLVDADDLNFAEPEPDDIDLTDTKILLLGEVADVLEDLKALLRVTAETADTKENFIMLLGMLAGKYPQVTEGRFLEPIVLYLLENCGDCAFGLTEAEVQEALVNPSFNEE